MLTVTIPAEITALCDIHAVKRELGLDSTLEYDPILEDLIARASAYICDICGRQFAQQTYLETVKSTYTDTLLLTALPIVSITSVTCDGSAITDYTVGDAASGQLYRRIGWNSSIDLGWGSFDAPFTRFRRSVNDRPFAITYVAGYLLPGQEDANLPGIIEAAAVKLVKSWYSRRDSDPSIASVSTNGLSVSYRGNLAIEAEIAADLRVWVR